MHPRFPADLLRLPASIARLQCVAEPVDEQLDVVQVVLLARSELELPDGNSIETA